MRLPTLFSPAPLTRHRRHSSSLSRKQTLTPPLIPLIKSPEHALAADQWVDIFDNPIGSIQSISQLTRFPSAPSKGTSRVVIKDPPVPIMFDGPARPKIFLPGARAELTSGQKGAQFKTGSEGRGRAREASRRETSSLPPPRLYDGPAFEWEKS